MTAIKEYITLISALFKNTPDRLLEKIEMKYVLWRSYSALCWAGLLVSRPDETISSITENHEDIHRQQALILGSYWKFYGLYILSWLGGLFSTFSVSGAYETISFEVQAIGCERRLDYKVSPENMKRAKIKNKFKVWRENKKTWPEYCRRLMK